MCSCTAIYDARRTICEERRRAIEHLRSARRWRSAPARSCTRPACSRWSTRAGQRAAARRSAGRRSAPRPPTWCGSEGGARLVPLPSRTMRAGRARRRCSSSARSSTAPTCSICSRSAASCGACSTRGHDVWLLDWGTPQRRRRRRARSATTRSTCCRAPPPSCTERAGSDGCTSSATAWAARSRCMAHRRRRACPPPALVAHGHAGRRCTTRGCSRSGAARPASSPPSWPRPTATCRRTCCSPRSRCSTRSAWRPSSCTSTSKVERRRLRPLLPRHGDLARGLGRLPRPRLRRLGRALPLRRARQGRARRSTASASISAACAARSSTSSPTSDYITPPRLVAGAGDADSARARRRAMRMPGGHIGLSTGRAAHERAVARRRRLAARA